MCFFSKLTCIGLWFRLFGAAAVFASIHGSISRWCRSQQIGDRRRDRVSYVNADERSFADYNGRQRVLQFSGIAYRQIRRENCGQLVATMLACSRGTIIRRYSWKETLGEVFLARLRRLQRCWRERRNSLLSRPPHLGRSAQLPVVAKCRGNATAMFRITSTTFREPAPMTVTARMIIS